SIKRAPLLAVAAEPAKAGDGRICYAADVRGNGACLGIDFAIRIGSPFRIVNSRHIAKHSCQKHAHRKSKSSFSMLMGFSPMARCGFFPRRSRTDYRKSRPEK